MVHKIVVCDHIHKAGLEILQKSNDIELINIAHLPKDQLSHALENAHVAITRSSTDVNRHFLSQAKSLRAIVRAGVGVDNVDIDECSRNGIVVMNVPTANTIAAVELTLAHILNAVRNFPGANQQLKDHKIWKREDWYGTELKNKTLGIIGFGNIGSRVGARAKAFEMNIITYDPYIKSSKATDLGITYTTSLEDILKCDIITIHTPKNRETINIIDKKQINSMKDGVILINCARGGLYNEEALYEGLLSQKIRWAGIDVFTKEPATNHPLLDLPNVYVTPHIGANTLESQKQIAIEAAQSAIEAARRSSFPNALNLPIKQSELPSSLKPYLDLTQKLGFLVAQLNKSSLHSITLTLEGEIGQYEQPLLNALLVGTLSASLEDSINFINAPYVANDQGIKYHTYIKDSQDIYKNLVHITLTSETKSISLAGTVFNENVLRIVSVNGFNMDINPKGRMIFFQNNDIPGVIGSIGTILAKHSVNIADFRLGRNHHQEALAVIVVDDDITQEILEELRLIPACINIAYTVI